ncbi:hypothetical protein [Streptomyces albus]|uniref:hypothetical protein n=1 Tax=Streptomyces albus TaxID=1888 RepID=UPI0033FAF69B
MSAPTRAGFMIRRGPMAADVIGRNFVMIFNAAMRDRRLSRRARGLLAEILTHRDGFGISEAALIANGPEGRDAIRTALRELERYGYLRRRQDRDEHGRLGKAVFEVTDMPEGLVVEAPAPWEPPKEPAEENPRSEPSTAKPSTAKPLHKKTTPGGGSTPSGKEDLSPAAADEPRTEGEREAAAPKDPGADGEGRADLVQVPGPGDAEVPEQRTTPGGTEAAQAAELVVQAYVAAASAAGVIADRRDVAGIRRDAAGLLAENPECTPEWLAQRAAEMPANRWSDLRRHVAKCKKPMRAPQRPARSGPCTKCMDSGWMEDENGLPVGKCDCRGALVPA